VPETAENHLAELPDFLFLAEHPALDFINTQIALQGELVDLLSSWPTFLTWLERAGLSGDADLDLPKAKAASALQQVRDFRQAWRDEVNRLSEGHAVSRPFLAEVNRLLAAAPLIESLAATPDGYTLTSQSTALPADQQVLAILARVAAQFLAGSHFEHLRKCANPECVLFFYDTTKNHRRQWCSGALCGNRHKVAAFRERRRQQKPSPGAMV